ncbi:hypothetical protein [Vibrio phage vB_VpaP_SJSY21]|nr:hypothetical protein [Vibrio phage vB_VpaP_SJSY21]
MEVVDVEEVRVAPPVDVTLRFSAQELEKIKHYAKHNAFGLMNLECTVANGEATDMFNMFVNSVNIAVVEKFS